ncbi:phage portal protein [Paracoccus sp. ME4]|uniref:phage portal protein n=1 Tax=Paracoccus sp. ME4 TaxID=3138066 RepID=UPI00398AC8E6
MTLMTRALLALGLARKGDQDSFQFTDGRSRGAQPGVAGVAVTDASAMGLDAVWACVNLISGTISSLPLQVFRRDATGHKTPAKGHPLYAILHDSPNYEQTAVDWLDALGIWMELRGNSYSRIERAADGRVIALIPAPAPSVAVKRRPGGDIEYAWSQDGERYRLGERDVLHIRGPGGDPLGGLSTLAVARNSLSAVQAAEVAAASTFKNSLNPSTVIKFKEWLTPAQRALAEDRLTQRYMGAVNAGRPFIAEGGVDISALSLSPEDAQMLETRQFSVEVICRFFGVPPALIGHAGASTAWPTSVEQQMIMFLTFTLRRRLRRIEAAMNKQLLTPSDRASGYHIEFNIEGLLRGDSSARSAFYSSALGAGWMTINEVRTRENLPRVDGGDTPRMQIQNVPITQAGNGDADL